MRRALLAASMMGLGLALPATETMAQVSPGELASLAREAYVYGFPMVDNYAVLHRFALDPRSDAYRGPVNTISHARDVAGPGDRTFVAPNVDTPYSYAWLDLRAEPIVLEIPAFEARRYLSVMLVDAYTYIIDYVTPRTNGHQGGTFLVAGPGWDGPTPPGIARVFRSPTDLALAFYRTQLFGPGDRAAVHHLQDRYRVTPLSTYLGRAAPAPAPPLVPVPATDPRQISDPVAFFQVLNWVLAHAPVLPGEEALRARFERIEVGPGRPFPVPDSATRAALRRGMQEGLTAMGERAKRVRSSAELFGTRSFLGDDYLTRATAAMIGIYGNAAEEYLGVGYQTDADGRPFDGQWTYRIFFPPGGAPPVGAFWSITVYGADRFLYPNTLNRYKISSEGLADLRRADDGSFTLYLQHESPGAALEPNWLPVPPGPFGLTFRTYLPGPAVRDGRWTAPPVTKVLR